jgi:hypothetical protein
VINAEFGREDYGSIRRGWNHLMPELTPNQIKLIVKVKIIIKKKS